MYSKENRHFILPEPDRESAAHSTRVAEMIVGSIADAGGSISFAEFMQLALYAPGLGYYVAGKTKFGTSGDFVTAPEISPVFGNILATECASVLREIPRGEILEFGAGSGELAMTMLRRLAESDSLPARYLILEVSPELKNRQEALLTREIGGIAERVSWVSDIPQSFKGVVIANEVADALPVERFAIKNGRVWQYRVSNQSGRFAYQLEPAADLLRQAVADIESSIGRRLEDGFESEVSLGISGWTTDICKALQQGIAIIIDYGLSRREYYSVDRRSGWLRCHFRHHAHDNPLVHPGIQDITTWVDFTTVAESAALAGAHVAGYVTQANFLLGGGLEAELANFKSLDIEEQVAVSGQVKLLTLPAEMGENFKFIGLRKGNVAVPEAFSYSDRSRSL